MKTAIIRELFGASGPWTSVGWNATSPKSLLEMWPSKTSVWGLICLLKADWYIIHDPIQTQLCLLNRQIQERVDSEHLRYCAAVRKYTTGIVSSREIAFEQYDLVITCDPILKPPSCGETLFAYYVNEHTDVLYRESLKKVIKGYDLFLAHMLDGDSVLNQLSQSLSFPYLYDPDSAQSLFSTAERQDAVWVDWRTLSFLGMVDKWGTQAEAAARRLENILRIPIKYQGAFGESLLGICDPPQWDAGIRYITRLASCKYYLSVGRNSGPGQGLCDAASVGCVGIGDAQRPYHRLVCHPVCLCEDLADLPKILTRVAASKNLQDEAIAWQNAALQKHFHEKPIDQLQKAVELKQTGSRQKTTQ